MSKKQKWEIFQEKCSDLYDRLILYDNWFAVNWYPVFGIDNFGSIIAATPPPLPSNPSNLDLVQQSYYNEAEVLAKRLNFLVTNYFHVTYDAAGQNISPPGWESIIYSDNWIEEDFFLNYQDTGGRFFWTKDKFPIEADGNQNYEDILGDDSVWHTEVGGPIANSLLEDIKVILENKLVDAPQEFYEKFFVGSDWWPGTESDFLNFSNQPPPDISLRLEDVLTASAQYLAELGQYGFTTKIDIEPASDTTGLGPAIIPADSKLEAQISSTLTANSTHYIGFALDPGRGVQKDQYFVPIRYSPFDDPNIQDVTQMTWDNEDYSLINGRGEVEDVATTDQYDYGGVQLPFGLGVIVTEIVQGKSGVWVGFVVDQQDQRLNENPVIGNVRTYEDRIQDATDNYTKILYTRPEFLRAKESTVRNNPDPYISYVEDLSAESDASVSHSAALSLIKANLPPGLEPIDPANNRNWLKMIPGEVIMDIFDFQAYNQGLKEIESRPENQKIDYATIIDTPNLRYSTGYFYFIVGESSVSTSEPGVESDASAGIPPASQESITEAKDKAWESLIRYFNKDTDLANKKLYEKLYKDYFVVVDVRVNTESTSPNNQKVLFAIRSDYIDALPDSKKHYLQNFDSDSEFANGRDYMVTFYAEEFATSMTEIADYLYTIKEIFDEAGTDLIVKDANDNEFNMDIINGFFNANDTSSVSVGDFTTLISDFLRKQTFPRSSQNNILSKLIKQAADAMVAQDTGDDEATPGGGPGSRHLIQIGIRDNGKIGAGVRKTISYILFSPDPLALIDAEDKSQVFDQMFYFDPYVSNEELQNKDQGGVRRSAIPLVIGIDNLRENFSGVYGSMALHYLYSYSGMIEFFERVGLDGVGLGAKFADDTLTEEFESVDPSSYDSTRKRVDMVELQKILSFSVPPLRVHISKQPETEKTEQINCQEIIDQLNSSSNVSGIEELELMERLYNSPKCREFYFNKFSRTTPATDPEATKRSLENKARKSDEAAFLSDDVFLGFKNFYQQVLFNMDMDAIIALLLACIQSKLGIPLTAEAICEAAILELIKNIGIDKAMAILITNAQQDPERYAALLNELEENNDNIYSSLNQSASNVRPSYASAPIATWMAIDGSYEASTIAAVRQLELGGTTIQLEPGLRPAGASAPTTLYSSGTDELYASDGIVNPILEAAYPSGQFSSGETYTYSEIEAERERLKQLGYSSSEIDALLVNRGFLRPVATQYESVLYGGGVLDPLIDATNSITDGRFGNAVAGANQLRNIGATLKDAKSWLNYIKGIINLQEICELLVGSLLDGLEDLLKDPAAFLTGGLDDWFDDFIENLKRRFSFPEPSFKFPDKLKTDDHIGDYGKKLLQLVLSMIATILGQILNLLIKRALENCIEEADENQGAANDPVTVNSLPTIEIPNLRSMAPVAGLDFPILKDMIDDLLDNLKLGQLCALLRGEASKQTLYNIFERIKTHQENKTQKTYESLLAQGLSEDEAYENARQHARSTIESWTDVQAMFIQIGSNMDLDFCNFLTPTTSFFTDICNIFYDADGKVSALEDQGIPKEQAQDQVNKDLQSLKNEIIDLAPALFPGNGGLSNILSAVPDICEIPGAFQVPPGVENSMNLITDNILDVAKIALVQDMSSLKFFSVPPRAVLTATDPMKMREATELFQEAIRRPYQKQCIAWIGPHRAGYFNSTPNSIKEHIKSYKLTYGAKPEVPTLEMDQRVAYGGFLKDAKTQTPNNEAKLIKDYYLNDNELHDYLQDFTSTERENNFFKPLTISVAINDPQLYTFNPEIFNLAREIFIAANPDLSPPESVEELISEPFSNNDNLINSIIAQSRRDIKPPYAHLLVYDINQLFKRSKTYNQGLAWPRLDIADDENVSSGEYVDQNSYDDGAVETKRFGYLRKDYSLDTVLKDITPKEDRWKAMFEYYTGFDADEITFKVRDNPGIGTGDRLHGDIEDISGLIENTYPYEEKDFVVAINDVISSNLAIIENEGGALQGEDISITEQVQEQIGENEDTGEPIFQTVTVTKAQLSNSDLHNLALFSRSPGLYSLRNIMNRILRASDSDANLNMFETNANDTNIHLRAFMELTVGEAIGLTQERLNILTPNWTTPIEAIDGVIFQNVQGRLYPAYVVYKETFIDPAGPLSLDNPQKMIEYFSGDEDPVNDALVNYLSDTSNFPQSLGFEDASSPYSNDEQEFDKLEQYINYNPNTLRYEIPKSMTVGPSLGASATNPALSPHTAELLNSSVGISAVYDYFSPANLEYGGSESVNSLITSLVLENKSDSLIYQNIPEIDRRNYLDQLDSFKDTYRVLKGKLTEREGFNVPPGILKDDTSVELEQFDFNFLTEASDEIQNLLSVIYGYDENNQQEDFNIARAVQKDLGRLKYLTEGKNAVDIPQEIKDELYAVPDVGYKKLKFNRFNNPELGSKSTYKLDPYNFKALVFGKFFTYKFKQMFDRYKSFENTTDSSGGHLPKTLLHNDEKLQYILTTYGFSSLQFAYSNQMFAKLRRSRLQDRSFMKKLWDKVLQSPLGSSVNPACRDIIEQIGVQSRDDIENLETDFFDLDEVKREILDYYKKSLCRDVYEGVPEDQNATRIALLHGVIKLLIKIYTLEMCFASIIAWDSFDIEDIFKTDLMTNIIINNMAKEARKERISSFATEILKRDLNIKTDNQLADMLKNKSALAYLVSDASRKISSIVKNMFNNSNPLRTGLQLDILKNSDEEFITEYGKKIAPVQVIHNSSITSSQDPLLYNSIYLNSGYEYVVDARLKDNIYTMNYGAGERQDLIRPRGYRYNIYNISDNGAGDIASKHLNVYGFNESANEKGYNSKHFLHSLPYNYFEAGAHWSISSPELENEDTVVILNDENYFNPDIPVVTTLGLEPARIYSYSYSFIYGTHPLHLHADQTGSAPELPYSTKVKHYAYRALSGLTPEDTPDLAEDYESFIKTNDLMASYLGRADAFNKENYQHTQFGNAYNGALGNMIFQPYVFIEDWEEEVMTSDTFQDKYTTLVYKETPLGSFQLDPCDDAYQIEELKYGDFIEAFFEEINEYRMENNVFKSYIFGYIPLPVWSHFYNQMFLKTLNKEEYEGLKLIFDKFGLEPFFKKISFGMRMSYLTAAPFNLEHASSFDLKLHFKRHFGKGKVDAIGTKDFPAHGLKLSKTLLTHRPYYVDASQPTQGALPEGLRPEFSKRFKICDELSIPIVDVEKQLIFVKDARAFVIEGTNELISLDKLGEYSSDTLNLFGTVEQDVDDIIYVEPTVEVITPNNEFCNEEEQAGCGQVCKEYLAAWEVYDLLLAEKIPPTLDDFNQRRIGAIDQFTGTGKLTQAMDLINDVANIMSYKIDSAIYPENPPVHLYPDYGPDFVPTPGGGVPHTFLPNSAGQGFIIDGESTPSDSSYVSAGASYQFVANVLFGDTYANSPAPPTEVGEPIGVGVPILVALASPGEYTNSYGQQAQVDLTKLPTLEKVVENWARLQNEILQAHPEDNVLATPNVAAVNPCPYTIRGYTGDDGSVTIETPGYTLGIDEETIIPPQLDSTQSYQLKTLLENEDSLRSLINNPHQFYYGRLAQTLLLELQETAEFKLIFDHLLPMRRYMALAFTYSGDSLSKFVPEPTDILDITKDRLSVAYDSIYNGLDYQFIDPSLRQAVRDEIVAGQFDSRGQNPDLTKQILEIILKTPLRILKGFVEVTDPAIIFAKAIIDAANAVQQAVVAGIESGIRITKQTTQALKDTAYSTMRNIEITAATTAGILPATIDSTLGAIPDPEFPQDNQKSLADYITIDIEDKEFVQWVLDVRSLPQPQANELLTPEQLQSWEDLKQSVTDLKSAQTEYVAAKKTFDDLDTELKTVIAELEINLAAAKKELKKVFQSPYLLPGMWSAMLPSMMPLGGGLVPPPFPSWISSTIPGMIYLMILFLDTWEEQQHNLSQEEELDCSDEL